MGKGSAALLAVALLLAGCSKPDTFRKEDQYVCRTGRYVISVFFTGSVTVFQDGRYVSQNNESKVKGAYPELKIQGAGLYLDCVFSSPETFTASEIERSGLDLPDGLVFRRDATVLDVNHDGVLDESQQIFSK